MSNQAGELIREKRKRKGWSQTVLGDFVGMSAATVHRIEHGERMPTDQEVQLLANTLGLDDALLLDTFVKDRHTRQNQLPHSAFKAQWDYAHPAIYTGKVWIQVLPASDHWHEPLRYRLRWGVWEKSGELTFDAADNRLSLVHYKHNDGLGLPLFLELSYPCYVVFGKDEPPDQCQQDIHSGWRRVEPVPPGQSLRFAADFIRQSVALFLRKLTGRQ